MKRQFNELTGEEQKRFIISLYLKTQIACEAYKLMKLDNVTLELARKAVHDMIERAATEYQVDFVPGVDAILVTDPEHSSLVLEFRPELKINPKIFQ